MALAALRLAATALLAVDAAVHAADASFYASVGGGPVTMATLFQAEAGAASVAALLVLVGWGRRWSWLPALLVGASAVGAVLLYRYVDVGALGPIPNMYEPTWQVPGKVLSAYAEGAVVVICALGFALDRRPRRSVRARRPATPNATARSGRASEKDRAAA